MTWGLLNLSNAIRENLPSDAESMPAPGQSIAFARGNQALQERPLVWFDSSWASNAFAPAGIKLSDQMVKLILKLCVDLQILS